MNREDYLRQLRKYLKRLPKEDYDNAMEYFTEYFDEAGPEGEQAAINELGSPKQAAGEVLANLLGERTSRETKAKPKASVGQILLIAILAVCAAPIGIPLVIAALALLLAAILVAACDILCVLIVGLCGALVGGKLILVGLGALPASVSGMLLLLGMGLLVLGAGILLCVLVVVLCKGLGIGLVRIVQKLIH